MRIVLYVKHEEFYEAGSENGCSKSHTTAIEKWIRLADHK